jgi:hypothetical protein
MVNYKNIILSIIICLLAFQFSYGQYDKLEDYRIESRIGMTEGLLKFTATIEPGFMFDPQLLTINLSGNLQYYLEDRFSVRGDLSYFFDTQQRDGDLLANHGLYFGGVYHFTKRPIMHPYLGFQPGIHLTQTQYEVPSYVYPQPSFYKIVPVVSIIGGADFYVSKYFNFFVAGRAIFGEFRGGKVPRPMNLAELRLSFGLGFHIGLKKHPKAPEEQ